MMLLWVSSFWSYPASRKILFLEAGLLCMIAKLMVICLPFRVTQKLLNLKALPNDSSNTEGVDSNLIIKNVFQTIDSISRHVFWTNTCLVRSITVKLLLRRRSIYTLLYLGLAKEKNGTLKAHAWIKVPSTNQTYDDGSGEYTTVAVLI